MKAPAKHAYDGQPFTIHIQNTAGDSMQMNLKHDADAPGAICCPHNGPLPSSTQVTYPTGWAGRISIGPVADENVITRGSTIEASFKNGIVQFDVSYVAGYTYPMSVASGSTAVLPSAKHLQCLLLSRPGLGWLQLPPPSTRSRRRWLPSSGQSDLLQPQCRQPGHPARITSSSFLRTVSYVSPCAHPVLSF